MSASDIIHGLRKTGVRVVRQCPGESRAAETCSEPACPEALEGAEGTPGTPRFRLAVDQEPETANQELQPPSGSCRISPAGNPNTACRPADAGTRFLPIDTQVGNA
jgi:hypothetical protein